MSWRNDKFPGCDRFAPPKPERSRETYAEREAQRRLQAAEANRVEKKEGER